ncbi:MAG TPA: glycosyl hydrolase family 18 protein [Puia sp.]|nr:glycosyl hydrolase family 18 protein [Puia sp.]
MNPRLLFLPLMITLAVSTAQAQTTPAAKSPTSSATLHDARQTSPRPSLAVIGYFAGRSTAIDSFPTRELTHIIFSFCHLKGNKLHVANRRDTQTIRKLVGLKQSHPQLKVILSLGGWGGCKTCADVFSTDNGRTEFARSVLQLTNYFHTDGIDLDWEYPALVNVPGYAFYPEDKDDFTALIRELRKVLGNDKVISFAAGGYTDYLKTSIDWKAVAPLVNYINLMSYDLVNGYATTTGHHTALYSTPQQVESTDHAVRYLDSAGVPLHKIVIGLAFYARVFNGVDSINYGLYRPCHFYRGVSYREQATWLSADSGWTYHWDPIAQAPWSYNAAKGLMASYDDSTSVRIKTLYALHNHLGGVMFWQLTEDRFFSGGLLDVIDQTRRSAAARP